MKFIISNFLITKRTSQITALLFKFLTREVPQLALTNLKETWWMYRLPIIIKEPSSISAGKAVSSMYIIIPYFTELCMHLNIRQERLSNKYRHSRKTLSSTK